MLRDHHSAVCIEELILSSFSGTFDRSCVYVIHRDTRFSQEIQTIGGMNGVATLSVIQGLGLSLEVPR